MAVRLEGWTPGQSLDLDPRPKVVADKDGKATATVQLRGSQEFKVVFKTEDGKKGSVPCTLAKPK
ncbi:hypothetical protein AB0F11_30760 [Streptomyces sp. NPDC032472]|uniref:hypothetical protein n=1 Tax=Streptomyces sp. NPDC032472 TaxID=3155018 RepID=UPI0033C08069